MKAFKSIIASLAVLLGLSSVASWAVETDQQSSNTNTFDPIKISFNDDISTNGEPPCDNSGDY